MAKTLKDFLNERQLGPMVVKNPDEQKFIDKHVVAKTADRNGNDDEVFKGSKVKMADRPKHRKGYNPGQDEEVYEGLSESTYEFDVSGEHGNAAVDKLVKHANSNGIKAKVHTYDGPGGGNPVIHLSHKDPKVVHSYAKKHIDPDVDLSDHKINEALKGAQHKIDANKNGKVDAHDFHLLRKKKKVAEEADQIDEISAGLAARAGDAADNRLRAIRNKRKLGTGPSHAETKLSNQVRKFDNYSDKKQGYTTEDVAQIDELLEANNLHWMDQEDKGDKARNRTPEQHAVRLKKLRADAENVKHSPAIHAFAKNRVQAYKNYHVVKEEAEQIDELSEPTVRTYYNKAGEQGKKIADKMKMGGGDWSKDGSDTKTLKKRAAGRAMALKRRSGEMKMSEDSEQIDELSKKTLGSYVVKSLAPGSEKSVSNLASKGGYKLGQAHDDDYTAGEKEDAKSVKRSLGVLTAVRKMTKEEAEQVNEKDAPHVKDYGPYGGRASSAKEKMIADFNKPKNKNEKPNRYTKESRAMAVASKLTTQYGSAPLNKEERLLTKLADLAETHKRTMVSVFEKLNEDNQYAFMQACDTADGIEQMLDFSISYRGE